jgi:enoyl-[acyl-carrier protein] reductase I
MQNAKLLEGKKGLIMGVANDRSIASFIAKTAYAAGAEIAYSYQGPVLKQRVEEVAKHTNSDLLIECDVTDMRSLDRAFEQVEKQWGELDFLVHSIAFSKKEELRGRYVDTSLDNFLLTMNVSCYSLVAITKRAEKLMKNGGSILTLTYYGAEKVIPNYNVMGVAKAALESSVRYLAYDLGVDNIRVNAISAGVIKTLASSGISGIRDSIKWNEENSPLKRAVSAQEVADTSLFLLSPLSSGTTGSVIYVDCGYNTMGMKAINLAE